MSITTRRKGLSKGESIDKKSLKNSLIDEKILRQESLSRVYQGALIIKAGEYK